MRSSLIVTTSKRPQEALVREAQNVARECGTIYVPRRHGRILSVERLCRMHGARAAYVVSRQRHELRALGGGHAFVNPGPLHVFKQVGRSHPLIRALCPEGEAPLVHLVDATLGLAKNAIAASEVLGCRVDGIESSPVMACLLREGLERLIREAAYWSKPTSRITVYEGDAATWLEAAGPNSTDVVYLDPMFDDPIPNPMTDVFRLVADTAPLNNRLLNAALSAARRRIVYRIPSHHPTEIAGPSPNIWSERIRGKHVDYLVALAQ